MFGVKRVYEDPKSTDGYRVLVDRLWPRGLSKEKARLNEWLKEIGPSNALRKWFAHDQAKWAEFEKKYKEELRGKKELLEHLQELGNKHKNVTLLFGAKDPKHNQAVVLLSLLTN